MLATSPRTRVSDKASDISDFQLLEQWRGGDQRSGAMLVSRYMAVLSRFFRNKLRNPDDANDLVSETMLACTKARDIIEEVDFRRYVFGVAFNQLRKHYRRGVKRGREHDDFSDICVGERDNPASPVTLMARRGETRLLVRALRRIPLNQQLVLEMSFFEGMSAPDISEIIDIPTSTVYTWQRRGKLRLAEVMRELADDPAQYESTMSDLESWAAQVRAHYSRPAASA